MLFPSFPLNKLKENDFLQVPWGVRPNVFSPYGVPSGGGPCIIIDTPAGEQKLLWNGTAFSNTDYSISIMDDVWCLVGPEIDFCFDEGNFICQLFPEGYRFIRPSGPSQDYRIIRIDAEEDHLSRISHYIAFVELEDNFKKLPVQ